MPRLNPIPYRFRHLLPGSAAAIENLGILDAEGQLTEAATVCFGADTGLVVNVFATGFAEVEELQTAPFETHRPQGPLPDALEELTELLALAAPLPSGDLRTGARLFNEILVNALGHRDLADPGPVVVDRYTDQVHISSPGGLRAEVEIRKGRLVGRRSKNPSLMGLLTLLGLAYQQGRGSEAVARLAPLLGYRVEIEAEDRVRVRLIVDPTRVEALQVPAEVERRTRLPAGHLADRIEKLLSDDEARTTKELMDAFGAPRSTVRKALSALETAGRVEKTKLGARSRSQSYRMVRRGLTATAKPSG